MEKGLPKDMVGKVQALLKSWSHRGATLRDRRLVLQAPSESSTESTPRFTAGTRSRRFRPSKANGIPDQLKAQQGSECPLTA